MLLPFSIFYAPSRLQVNLILFNWMELVIWSSYYYLANSEFQGLCVCIHTHQIFKTWIYPLQFMYFNLSYTTQTPYWHGKLLREVKCTFENKQLQLQPSICPHQWLFLGFSSSVSLPLCSLLLTTHQLPKTITHRQMSTYIVFPFALILTIYGATHS